jgi:polysaccharide pyruvyl transferase WcaK-like protein
MRIGLFGHYGHRNFGDEAIITAVAQNLRRHLPDVEFCGFSSEPDDTAARYGIPAYPIRRLKHVGRVGEEAPLASVVSRESAARPSGWLQRTSRTLKQVPGVRALARAARALVTAPSTVIEECRFLGGAYHALGSLDALLVCGSNQFLDNFGGVFGYPYTLLKWSILARMRGVTLMYISVGAGPIDSIWSRLFVRVAVLLSAYTSFRDHGSKRLMETALLRNLGPVFPDLAHSLAHPPFGDPTRSERPTVAINVMANYDPRYWCEPNDDLYRQYVHKMAAFSSELLRRGYPIFFFSTQFPDYLSIDDVVSSLDEDVVRRIDREALVKQTHSVENLMDVLTSADIVVGARFHATLLALRAARPVLGVCYYRKAQELLREFGQEAYAVPFETFDPVDLMQRFSSLERARTSAVATISRAGERHRADLERQYHHIVDVLQSRSRIAARRSSLSLPK